MSGTRLRRIGSLKLDGGVVCGFGLLEETVGPERIAVHGSDVGGVLEPGAKGGAFLVRTLELAEPSCVSTRPTPARAPSASDGSARR